MCKVDDGGDDGDDGDDGGDDNDGDGDDDCNYNVDDELMMVMMMITCQPSARESKATKTPSLLVLKAP